MANNPKKFAKELSNFMKIDESKTRDLLLSKQPQNSSTYKRIWNYRYRILPKTSFKNILPSKIYYPLLSMVNIIGKKINAPAKTPATQLEKINQYYAESNYELSNLINTDLKQYNYPM